MTVCPDAVERRAHTAHPSRVGGIVGVHLRLLRVPAPVNLYRVARKPCDVRHGRKHQQRVDLSTCDHDGRRLNRVRLHRRLPARRTDEPAQSEAGYTYKYVWQYLHKLQFCAAGKKKSGDPWDAPLRKSLEANLGQCLFPFSLLTEGICHGPLQLLLSCMTSKSDHF